MLASLFADPMRALIFAAAHLFGGSLGGGVLAVSLAVRVAFFPLTLRLARRERQRRRITARIAPEIERLKKKFAAKPERFAEATHAIYRREGIQPVDSQALLGGLARLPAVAGIYGALRSIRRLGSFGWIADIAKPNLPLALLVTAGSATSAYLASHGLGTSERTIAASTIVGAAISLAFLVHMSAAVALSWAASVAGDVVQHAMLLREERRASV